MTARSSEPELLERELELALLGERLAASARGEGSLVLVEGSAGTGKTALLRSLRPGAGEAGLRTLTAVGGQLEREFAFGLVRQLFEPLALAAAPQEREQLFAGAAALAAPVVGAAPSPKEATVDASFATLHGLYWLVVALADRGPLLLSIDDAHWADPPSLRFLDFLSRRVEELPVLVVAGLRPNEPGAEHELLGALAEAPGAEVLRPRALSAGAARTLVEEGLGPDTADEVAASAHEATAGNPLLLRELVRTLAGEDTPPTAAAVLAAVPSSVTRSVERRLAGLPADVQALARALAVLGDRSDPALLAAALDLDETVVHQALATMRAAELVEEDAQGDAHFVHPLIGQAVAQGAARGEQRRLHRRAVEMLRDRAGAEETMVVHLLAAPPLREPWVVAVLRAAAARATEEGAPDAAVRRLRRALEEGPKSEADRAELELALGEAGMRAGDAAAGESLMAAAEAEDPVAAAQALGLLLGTGYIDDEPTLTGLLARGRAVEAQLEGTEHGELLDVLRAQMLSSLTVVPGMSEERARALGKARERPDGAELAMLAYESAAGGTRADTLALVERALVVRPVSRLATVEQPSVVSWLFNAALGVDASQPGARALPEAEATAREHGSLFATALVVFNRSQWEDQFGSAATSEALAREALGYLEPFGSDVVLAAVRAHVVLPLTLQARLEEAETLAALFPDDELLAGRIDGGTVWSARLTLRLAQGRLAEAVADGRRLQALCARYGWPRYPIGLGAPRLARALALAGERDEARELAEAEADDAARRGVAALEAESLMALGHALEGKASLEAFRGAAEAGGRSDATSVQASVEYELGAALRRANRRADAREHLGRARDLAHRSGATGLLERATEELAVAGGRPRRIALSGAESLTPSERRVAEHAARGLTNREIAELLFVTRKTVEFQLGAAYGKLGIRSRTQLPGALEPLAEAG